MNRILPLRRHDQTGMILEKFERSLKEWRSGGVIYVTVGYSCVR